MVVLLLLAAQAYAQSRTITGIVTDNGAPLPGVSIKIQGTKFGTQTGIDGKFSIAVASGPQTLIFSFLGYVSKTVVVTGRTVNVALEPNQKLLSEIVVVGYGNKAVKDLTGSIAIVGGEKLAAESNVSFEQALSGKVAGVQIGTTGGVIGDGVQVRVRGINSISNSSQPLIIVDGVALNGSTNLTVLNSGNGDRFDPLTLINPDDIESVNVLKDAGAAVIYGSRAANGVIQITTKKGKAGTSKVSADSKISWSNATSLPKLLNGDDFITINNEKESNASNKFGTVVIAKESDVNGDGISDRTDWMKELYRTAITYDNNVSLSGGTEKSTYYASARYLNQQGIAIGNNLRTGQVRLNMDMTPKKWFKGGISFSYSKSLNDGILTDRYLAGSTVSGLNAFPTVSPYNPANKVGYNLTSNGTLGFGNNVTSINGTSLIQNTIYNTVASSNLQRNQNTPQQALGNIYMEIQPVTGLRLTTKYGIDYLSNFEDQYDDPNIGGLGFAFNGLVQDYFRTRNQWQWSNYASYDHTFAQKHRVSATAGVEYTYLKDMQTYSGASDFTDAFFKTIIDNTYTGNDPSSGTIQLWSGGTALSTGLSSMFARAGYIYDDKYLLEGSIRSDEYSAFGLNSRRGTFPSGSVGYVISQEDFMKSVKWLNYLKFRGSYGLVGNSGVDAYAARTLYGGALYASQGGFATSKVGDPNLRWETSRKLDVGFDARIFNSRISVVADYFNNDVSGLILNAPVAYTVGIPASAINTNIGSMYNRGVELTFNTVNITAKDFKWTSSLNFSYIKNKVTALVTEADIPDANFSGSVASVGRTLGVYKLIQWAGVDPANGNSSFFTKDGIRKFFNPTTKTWSLADGTATTAISSSDAVYSDKSGTPKYYGGFDNTFSYKNFDLNISLIYEGGFSIYNSTKAAMLTNFFQNNYTDILSRWTTPGQVTDVPRLYLNDNTGNQTSTRFLEKGDFLRCRTISLAYNFRESIFKKLGIDNLKLYGQVYNAFLITGYSGPDPEVNYNRSNTNIAQGIDNRAVPQTRVFTLGVSGSF